MDKKPTKVLIVDKYGNEISKGDVQVRESDGPVKLVDRISPEDLKPEKYVIVEGDVTLGGMPMEHGIIVVEGDVTLGGMPMEHGFVLEKDGSIRPFGVRPDAMEEATDDPGKYRGGKSEKDYR
jgi:formylmethanofuran dehydrogenase subunit C